MIERDELGHVFLSTVPELLCGLAIERPFASHIQVFDNYRSGFSVGADSKVIPSAPAAFLLPL